MKPVFLPDREGKVIYHPTLKLVSSLWKLEDADGNFIVQQMLERQRGVLAYCWQSPQENRPRQILSCFSTIAGLDWLVASSSYTKKFMGHLSSLKRIFTMVFSSRCRFLFWWDLCC
ncbi:MAG: Cache 3/Cache 2 fusion domain-containing protein [Deltaproteobacteria bacterium]|nr:Cache 3/Cache 2 fusion domain-containing protein [Candidatus Anaeroferrophillacea bacterium]